MTTCEMPRVDLAQGWNRLRNGDTSLILGSLSERKAALDGPETLLKDPLNAQIVLLVEALNLQYERNFAQAQTEFAEKPRLKRLFSDAPRLRYALPEVIADLVSEAERRGACERLSVLENAGIIEGEYVSDEYGSCLLGYRVSDRARAYLDTLSPQQ